MVKKERVSKLLIVTGLILIIGSTLFSIQFIYKKYKDKEQTNKIIDKVFINKDVKPIEEIEIPKEFKTKSSNNNSLNNEYLGYIEFPNYNIKRLIKLGTDKEILDNGFVGMLSTSSLLDDEIGNIILAGHNNNNIFAKLHHMKINDSIKIVTHNSIYNYVIKEKHTISENDFSYFKNENDKKKLTLVTCKNNNYQRLIVIAELRS